MVGFNKIFVSVFVAIFALLVCGVLLYLNSFAAPQKTAEPERFIVPISTALDDSSEIAERLKSDGFIKHEWTFNVALLGWKNGFFTKCVDCIMPGAYKISKSMDASEIADVFKHGPYMKWISFIEGLRKEEIADVLAAMLGWSVEEKEKWITVYTEAEYDYIEGVYFPDTYLIPIDEPPLDVAKRLRARFEDKFAPYASEALEQNIKWTTLLKIASIVEREAAGKEDMPIIAGILWNRLDGKMKLDIDATVQYARGNTGAGWWAPITPEDKQIDSSYNTYKYKGLPPHPISNPGLAAINAVLNPVKTDCIYYLHDIGKQIHCADTYEEHKQNIEIYLKND